MKSIRFSVQRNNTIYNRDVMQKYTLTPLWRNTGYLPIIMMFVIYSIFLNTIPVVTNPKQ